MAVGHERQATGVVRSPGIVRHYVLGVDRIIDIMNTSFYRMTTTFTRILPAALPVSVQAYIDPGRDPRNHHVGKSPLKGDPELLNVFKWCYKQYFNVSSIFRTTAQLLSFALRYCITIRYCLSIVIASLVCSSRPLHLDGIAHFGQRFSRAPFFFGIILLRHRSSRALHESGTVPRGHIAL